MVQVPHCYVPIVLDRALSPRQAWAELAGAIIADGNVVPCAHLLTWLRHTLTL